MDNLITVAVVLGLLLLFELYNEKRRYNDFVKKLEEGFGKLSDETYTDIKFANIKHLYENKEREGFVIDDITWNDLDMDELYKMINNTSSSIGMEYLYNLLREPCFNLEELKKRDELIDLFENDKEVRKDIQVSLACIGKKDKTSVFGYMEEVFLAESKSVLWHIIQGILVFVFAGMIFMNSKYAIGLLLGIIFYNVISYYVYKAKIDKYLDFFALMVRVSNACKKLSSCKNNTIEQYNNKIKKAGNIIKKVSKCSVVLSQSSVTGSISDMFMD
ncbi:MAG: hypothetical protein K6G26_00440, partial [Lachnospiraceae bacterium]|nr:hypothetical protein [Lachnospiraceae bacterium]